MSIEHLKNDKEKLNYFITLLKTIASGEKINDNNVQEYRILREKLLSSEKLKNELPAFVKENGSLKSFWVFIKEKYSTYEDRVSFLSKEFEPALQKIDQSKNQTSLHNQTENTKDSIKRKLKEYFKSEGKLLTPFGEFIYKSQILGEGGTSVVELFEFNNKQFAIKFLLENATKDNSVLRRFKQAYLNLVCVNDSSLILPQINFNSIKIEENIEVPYIIMPKIKYTLKSFIEETKDKEEFNFGLFEFIFEKLLDTIDSIHHLGIIHRDIKPENIFLYKNNWVLGDFDIASFDKEEYMKFIETRPKERLANFHFSAPEQSLNNQDEITKYADWYAFGQVLYWMIIGKTLRGQEKISFTHIDERYNKYASLVTKLLSENPKNRFGSKEEIKRYLEPKDLTAKENLLIFEKNIILKHMNHLGASSQGFKKFDDFGHIEEIMNDLKKHESKLNCWWSEGFYSSFIYTINKLSLCDKCWLINGLEIKIKSIWIFKHYSNLGYSCIIIETDTLKPTGIKKIDPECKYESYALYNEHIISIEECDAGWADIDGKKVELNGKAEKRARNLKQNIFFIVPHLGALMTDDDSINIVGSMHREYQKTKLLNVELLMSLENIVKKRYRY